MKKTNNVGITVNFRGGRDEEASASALCETQHVHGAHDVRLDGVDTTRDHERTHQLQQQTNTNRQQAKQQPANQNNQTYLA